MAKKKSTQEKESSGKVSQSRRRFMSKDSAETILRTGALLAYLPYVYACGKYHGTSPAFVRSVEQTLVEHLSGISTPDQLVSLKDGLQTLGGKIDRLFGGTGNEQLMEELVSIGGARDTPAFDDQIIEFIGRAPPTFIREMCDSFRESVVKSFSRPSGRGLTFAVSIHREHQLGCPSNIESFLFELLQHSGPPDSWHEHQSSDDLPWPRSTDEIARRAWSPPQLTVESLSRNVFRHIDSSEPVGDEVWPVLVTNLRPILGTHATGDSVNIPEPTDFCGMSFGASLNWIVRWLSVLDCKSDCDQLLAELRSDIEYDDHDLAYDRDRGILRRRGFEDPVQLTGDSKVLFELFYPIKAESVTSNEIERTRSRMGRSVEGAAIDQSRTELRRRIKPLRLRLKNIRKGVWRIEVNPV